MNYKIVSLSSTQYSQNNYKPTPNMEIICTLLVDGVNSSIINSNERFEHFLSGLPEWCSYEMMQEALYKVYPERFL